MNTPKISKKARKTILTVLGITLIVAVTAGVSYKLGTQQASTHPKSKAGVTAPRSTNLTDVAKKAAENNKSDSKSTSSGVANSSGFFRLSGTIQSNKNKTVAIKLGDGTVVTLTVSDKTKFYTGTPRAAKPISELKAGTSAIIIGTIGSTGTFTASNIQAQAK